MSNNCPPAWYGISVFIPIIIKVHMNELKFKTFLVKDAMGKIAKEYLIHKF